MKKLLVLLLLFSAVTFGQSGVYSIGKVAVKLGGEVKDVWKGSGEIIIHNESDEGVTIEVKYGDDINIFIESQADYSKKYGKIFYNFTKPNTEIKGVITIRRERDGRHYMQMYTDEEGSYMYFFHIVKETEIFN